MVVLHDGAPHDAGEPVLMVTGGSKHPHPSSYTPAAAPKKPVLRGARGAEMIHVQYGAQPCAWGVLGLGGCNQQGRAPPCSRTQAHNGHSHVSQGAEASLQPCQLTCPGSTKTWPEPANPLKTSIQNALKRGALHKGPDLLSTSGKRASEAQQGPMPGWVEGAC